MTNDLRILVAEDDPDDRFLIQHALAKADMGSSAHFVVDGQEAVDYLKNCDPFTGNIPTILLLDLKMPRLDGFQVLEWLNSSPCRDQMLVIIFTSSADPRDVKRAQQLTADAFLTKPHEPAEYTRIVQNLHRQFADLISLRRPKAC